MMATIPLTSREARRRIKKSRIDWLPPTVPTFNSLRDVSILGMDRLGFTANSPKPLREIAGPKRGPAPADAILLIKVFVLCDSRSL
jgi:hypothetical protein